METETKVETRASRPLSGNRWAAERVWAVKQVHDGGRGGGFRRPER